MNIATLLEEQARRAGDRAAVIERGNRITFRELNRAAAGIAADLGSAGVRAGMRALVFSPMSIPLYAAVIALFRLRAVAVFADPSAGLESLDRAVSRVRPGAFIASPRAHWLRLVSPAIRGVPIKLALGGRVPGAATLGSRLSDAGNAIAPCDPYPCDPETPAVITFTSGSTGEPKAAVRTHGFLIAQHRVLVDTLALTPGETDLCTLPMFVLANLASGVTSVIPDTDLRSPGTIDPAPVDAQIRRTRPTRIVASPTFLTRLAAHATRHGGPLDTLRRVYVGGAPVFPKTLDAIGGAAPTASVVAVYGSTEAEPIAQIERRDITTEDRAAMARGAGILAGRPAPRIELRILRDRWGTAEPTDGSVAEAWTAADLERESLPAGDVGEIVVSGEHVLAGYLDGGGDTETKIRVSRRVWHRTGDAGYLDAQGRLWLLGRCSAKASDSRGVLYPLAVECAASEVSGVSRTAFVARTHGLTRLLAVEVADGAAAAAVRAALAERLAWTRLDDIVIIDRIPLDRRHNAKIDYPALRRVLDGPLRMSGAAARSQKGRRRNARCLAAPYR